MIKIGLVGTGGMGRVHYANFKEIPDCAVTALCGASDKAKAAAEEWGLPLYATIEEMAAHVDIVDICTPTYTHHDMVMESLRCGKDTIVEKPIALSSTDAREMLDTACAKGCQLYVAQVLQFTKEVEILRRIVKEGTYGKPLDAVFERLSACPQWVRGGWLFDRDKSGLLPFDLHIHDLDIIVSLFGTPDGVAVTSCGGADKTYREQYRFQYTFGDLHVCAEAAWFNAPIPWTARWRVYFENGMLINDGQTLTGYQFGREPEVFDTADAVTVSTGINVPPCGWYYNELSHFLDCARRHEPSPYVTREQLLTVVSLLEKISENENG